MYIHKLVYKCTSAPGAHVSSHTQLCIYAPFVTYIYMHIRTTY